MNLEELEILRCPFCGGRLSLQRSAAEEMRAGHLETGLLGCSCCAFPVVAGIPFLRAGRTARTALDFLDARKSDEAFYALVGVEGVRRERFEALRKREHPWTFRETLGVLSPNPEGVYFLYRFSDPGFLVSDALVRVVAQDGRRSRGPWLDLCGGSGHLARTLCGVAPADQVWLADLEFWKLWLAKQFIVPDCHTVCCDAAQPLPFARESFSIVVCADALHYIWPRRMAVSEMTRLVRREGVILATGLHNALCENASAGSPLDPAGWRGLFEEIPARLFAESTVLDSVLANRPISLSANHADADLPAEPTIIAIATECDALFRDHSLPDKYPVVRQPALNPLYQRETGGTDNTWTLKFPSPEYAEEFTACRRYLPERLTLTDVQIADLNRREFTDDLRELIPRRVILDLPNHYL